jgi:hypothetical protein
MAKKGGTGFTRALPSEHLAARTKEQADDVVRQEEAKRKEARILAAFDWILKQENGRIVWAWLFARCGYNKAVLLRAAGGDVAPLSTECAAAQREVYRDLRKMIATPELLAAAEFEAEFGVVRSKEGEKK